MGKNRDLSSFFVELHAFCIPVASLQSRISEKNIKCDVLVLFVKVTEFQYTFLFVRFKIYPS